MKHNLAIVVSMFILVGLVRSTNAQTSFSTEADIIFIRDYSLNSADLFHMDLISSNEVQLTNVLGEFQRRYVSDADCEPATNQIVFTHGTALITMDGNGENKQIIMFPGSYVGVSWSPSAARIAFDANLEETDNSEIFTIDPDGSDLIQLTDNNYEDILPDWSSDGQKLVSVFQENNLTGLNVMASDGSNIERITQTNFYETDPAWSPDGSRIAFASNRSGMFHIYTIDPDGTDLVQLTTGLHNNLNPIWSPDGDHILFRSDRTETGFQLFVMANNGSDIQRITPNTVDNLDHFPVCWLLTPKTDLTGQITLQAQVSGSSNYALPPTIKLVDQISETVVSTHTPTTDATGEFIVEDIPQGAYDIWVKHDKGLAVMQEVELEAATVPFDFGTILMGDANNDNVVGLTDFSLVSSSYGKSMGQAGYDARADFNGSNSVTLADFSILSGNYDAMGVPDPEQSGARIAPLSSGTVDLTLTPDINMVAVGQEFDVTVQVEAGEQLVDGAAVVLSFDPALLEVVSVTAGTSLPFELSNGYDNAAGQVSYAAGALEVIPSGTFDLLTVRFRALAATASTGISFTTDGATGVTYAGESVLNASEPAGVTITE